MANLCPPDLVFEDGRFGESVVYKLLGEGLKEQSWWVFYGVRSIIPGSMKSREIDFVVAHPDRGCLFIEVKGGRYTHDPVLGWCYEKGGNLQPDTRHGGPYKQVETAAYQLLADAGRTLEWPERAVPFRWATGVIFPTCSLRRHGGVLPAGADERATAEEAVCETPQLLRAWILRRFQDIEAAFPGRHRHDPKSVERFISRFLAPRVTSLSRLASQIARSRTLDDVLTAEQQAVVRLLTTRDRVLVSGYAGTGKTFMAVNRAVTIWDTKTKAGAHPRIGIVCFNVALAQQIRQEMLPPDTGIEVFYFHQLCDEAGREAGMEAVLNKDEAYLSRGCVERLEESFLSGRLRPFDALIVDEAQDLEPAWIVAMDECLLAERGSIAVFYDPLQELYERGEVLRQRFGAPYPVTTNCRNSVAICDLVRRTLPVELAELRVPAAAMPGAAPRILRYEDDQDQRHQLARTVEFLISEHGLRPRQIILLAPFQKARTCLANETKLCGRNLVEWRRLTDVSDPNVLPYSTIHSFKGLDADVVILHDVKDNEWSADPTKLYVAFSRARFGLFVLSKRGVLLPKEVEEYATADLMK